MDERTVSPRQWPRFAFPLVFLLLGLMWAVASPVGSSADDDFHLPSIWCAWGQSQTCVPSDVPGTYSVPRLVATTPCYAFDTGKDASCTTKLRDDLVATDRVNPRWGVYPPGFYLTMRAFVGGDVTRSVLAMRAFNVLVATLFLAALMALARPVVTRGAVMAWSLAVSPVAIFFIASTNPSSWVITGVGVMWAFLLSFARNRSWRSRRAVANLLLATAAALLALLARADAAVYLAASVVAVVILAWPQVRRRVARHRLLSAGALVVVVLGMAAAATNLTRYSSLPLRFPGATLETDQPNPLIKTLMELPAFLVGVLGGQGPRWSVRDDLFNTGLAGYTSPGFTYGVSWVDVQNPSISGVLTLVAVAGAVFIGLSAYTRRRIAAVAWLIAVIVCQVVLMRAWVGFAAIWWLQPRYFAPIVLVVLGVILYRPPFARPMLNGAQRWLVILLVGTGAAFTYAATVRRFTNGQLASLTNLSTPPAWWWDTPVAPSALMVLAALAGFLLVYVGMSFEARPAPRHAAVR